jgi:hypothetical protein
MLMKLTLNPDFFRHRPVNPPQSVINGFEQDCMDFLTAKDSAKLEVIRFKDDNTSMGCNKQIFTTQEFRNFFHNFHINDKYTSISEFFKKRKEELTKKIDEISIFERFYTSVAEFLSRHTHLLDQNTRSFVSDNLPSLLAKTNNEA